MLKYLVACQPVLCSAVLLSVSCKLILNNQQRRLLVLQACFVCADQSADSDLVLRQAVCSVERKFDIHHITVQVERYCAASLQDCIQCQVPKDQHQSGYVFGGHAAEIMTQCFRNLVEYRSILTDLFCSVLGCLLQTLSRQLVGIRSQTKSELSFSKQ